MMREVSGRRASAMRAGADARKADRSESAAGGAESPVSRAEPGRRGRESVGEGPTMIFWDLLGSCNLRCPACGAGATPGINEKGLITDEMFFRILDRLHGELTCRQLHFYNWAEPLIHPRIVDYCRAAANRGFHVHLSSNLNYLRDADGLIGAGIKTLRISVSGFTQAVYEVGHRGGDIERVKQNMRKLSAARERVGSRTKVHVYYHKYRHSVDEAGDMEEFARGLGFEFVSDWAFYMPLERMFTYLEGGLSEDERGFADEAICPDICSSVAMMQPHRGRACEAIDQLVLNWRGEVMLCCALYDERGAGIGSVLDLDWKQIQRIRYAHQCCKKCMHYGIHVLYVHYFIPQLRTAMERLAEAQCRLGGSVEGAASDTCGSRCEPLSAGSE